MHITGYSELILTFLFNIHVLNKLTENEQYKTYNKYTSYMTNA